MDCDLLAAATDDAAPAVAQPLLGVVQQLVDLLGGANGRRDDLQRTAARATDVFRALTGGDSLDLRDVIEEAIVDARSDNVMRIRDIEVVSLSAHHLLPFFGFAHITCVPHRRTLAPDALPRIVAMFARRLQTQERLTGDLAHALHEALRPAGLSVVIDARHCALTFGGVCLSRAWVTTEAVRGAVTPRLRER